MSMKVTLVTHTEEFGASKLFIDASGKILLILHSEDSTSLRDKLISDAH